jgi:hypothetical protein
MMLRLLLLCLLAASPLAAARAQAGRGAPSPPPAAPQAAPQEEPQEEPEEPQEAPAPTQFPSNSPTSKPDVPPAGEQVVVWRLSDVVAVRVGPTSRERVLYYFDPSVKLAEGGHLEQGSGGHSEVTISGGGLLAMYSSGHIELVRLAPDGDVVRLPVLTRLEVRAGDRPLELQLPAGTACELAPGNLLLVTTEPGRLRIRNQGDVPFGVTGDLRLSREAESSAAGGRIELQPGEEVFMPNFAVGGEEGVVTDLWGTLPVRHSRGTDLDIEGPLLRMTRAPESVEATEVYSVRGVYTLSSVGSRLVIHDPHWVEPSLPPQEQAVEEGTEPDTYEQPSSDAGAKPPGGKEKP